MVNLTHLKVLLQKDLLTLRRNKGFLIAFVFLPVALMIAFIEIQQLVSQGDKEGSLVQDNFQFTSTQFDPQSETHIADFMNVPPYKKGEGDEDDRFYFSNLDKCNRKNSAKYHFTKIAIIAEDETVRNNAKDYFQNVVVPRNLMKDYEVVGASSQDDIFHEVKTVQEQPYCFAVNILKFDTTNNDYEFEYSFSKDVLPDTNLPAYNSLQLTPDLLSWSMWFSSGAVTLYPEMSEFIARSKMPNPDFTSPVPIYSQVMGYAPMRSQKFIDIPPIGLQQLVQFFPFFFMIIYLIPFYYITSKIASEKESKSREGMKMMGLTDGTYFLSWFIIHFLISFLTSIILALCSGFGIFTNISIFLFFVFCMLYSITLYGWAFCIVAFLPTKRSSGIAATLFHIITFYLSYILQDPLTPSGLQYGMSILPNICMNQLIKQVFFYNFNTSSGLAFSTMSIKYEGYSFRGGLLVMIFDVFFWTALGLYFDQVIPSQFGVAKPWNFCCKRKARRSALSEQEKTNLLNSEKEKASKNPDNFEPVSDNLKKQEQNQECLFVRGLVKKFGEKTAVNGTNLTMYNGQIFALLGHNGAGKTTTISMLTGLLEPTEGHAEVFGIDIFSQMDEVRKNLGVCPQHDVLFDFLTPEDHLRLFAAFKGTPKAEIEGQVQKMLEEIDLADVKKQMSKTLSGGQKRKLSVAIAMIGNSKVVMLDEPTSGMDTAARRRLWDMLKKNKAGRIVILTTHYMDEADMLGDRIAIMAEGDVQCTGSSLFLKNRYGVGYNLVIAKKTRSPAPQVDEFIMARIPEAKKMQEVSSEIAYQLPKSSSGLFKQFFAEFDENLSALGINSYGVGITTLEEVFLKIGHGEEVEQERFDREQARLVKSSLNDSSAGELEEFTISENADTNVFFSHTIAIMKKKILMQVRDKKTLGIDTIFPIILIIAGLALSTIAIIKDGVQREMSPFIFPPTDGDKYGVLFNANSKFITEEDDMQSFFTDSYEGLNASAFTTLGQMTIPISDDPAESYDILQQLDSFDKQVYNRVFNDGEGPFAGQFYLNNLNPTPIASNYSGILLLNSTSQSVAGAWGSFAHTAFLKHFLVSKNLLGKDDHFSVKYTDKPLPLSREFQSIVKSAAGSTSAILMAIAWMMISDSLVQNIIKERQRSIKHQIMVSGSSLTAYWTGNFIADCLFQAIPAVVGIIGVKIFDIDVPQVWALFLVTIFANPAFIYFFSFLFEKDDAGSLTIKMLYMVLGIIAPITISILQVVNEHTIHIANILRWFFYPFPIYSLTFGYMSIANREIIQMVKKLDDTPASYSRDVAGPSLYFLIAAVPFYWILVACFEYKLFDFQRYFIRRSGNPHDGDFRARLLSQNEDMDEDIIEEKERVKGLAKEGMPVRVNDVTKHFGKVRAVNDVSFGMEFGECFALLGVSGAGKTTLFKCLTGDIYPSQGELSINGFDVTTASGFGKARKLIGYCPQFDAIFEGLTVKEHLQIYAKLKGIPARYRDRLIDQQIKDMDLEDYVHIRANNLSGGNKRKLSVAMAMIGNPPIVFLDEPSTGVDPQAKRFMWNIVSKISTQRKKSAVIITTHSMEEAEALCTKMGIMVSGQFRCFGSSQHIKDKFGTGYEIEVKVRTLSEEEIATVLKGAGLEGKQDLTLLEMQAILSHQAIPELAEELAPGRAGEEFALLAGQGKASAAEFVRWSFAEGQGNKAIDFLEEKFKQFEVLEHYGNSWKLKVSRDNYSIGFLFGMMEDNQSQFDISEYSITQTTLEQIFNNFALEAEWHAGKERRSTRKRLSSKAKSNK